MKAFYIGFKLLTHRSWAWCFKNVSDTNVLCLHEDSCELYFFPLLFKSNYLLYRSTIWMIREFCKQSHQLYPKEDFFVSVICLLKLNFLTHTTSKWNAALLLNKTGKKTKLPLIFCPHSKCFKMLFLQAGWGLKSQIHIQEEYMC